MKLDLKRISGTDGAVIPFSYDADLTKEEMNGEYPFRTPVHIEGEVRNHLGVLRLQASASALYETQCARCLAPVKKDVTAQCSYVLVQEVQEDDRDDMYLIDGQSIELDDIIIPALLLEVDFAYYCKPDCKGLCPKCGKNLNEGPCGCSTREIDSRLAVLQKLLDKDD